MADTQIAETDISANPNNVSNPICHPKVPVPVLQHSKSITSPSGHNTSPSVANTSTLGHDEFLVKKKFCTWNFASKVFGSRIQFKKHFAEQLF
jgi:hypothetical protein